MPQILVGVQRLSNCKICFERTFSGGFHLHCLTSSLQILIVMLTIFIRSCLTVFNMNRAPGFMRSATRSVYCIVFAVCLFDLVFENGFLSFSVHTMFYMFTATSYIPFYVNVYVIMSCNYLPVYVLCMKKNQHEYS